MEKSVTVIPRSQTKNDKTRVAAYARVSTEQDEQANSLANQIDHYKTLIQSNPCYVYIDVYYDFGISGYKEKRPGLQKMMEDARAGLIDMIITKSITRLARNTDIVLRITRELKELGIGVFFELQNINTLTAAGELLLTVYAAFGQAEIDSQREISLMTYRRKCEEGNHVNQLQRALGYTKDKDGNVIIDEDAKWVRKMYELRAEGYNCGQIARYINNQGVRTKRGFEFTAVKVGKYLHDVIYKGDYITQKYYKNENHVQVKNTGELPSMYIKNHHPRIVSDELWNKVQEVNEQNRRLPAAISDHVEKNEINYPYINLLFCGVCGHRLVRIVPKTGNHVYWVCSGRKLYSKKFCPDTRVPDSVVRSWGVITGNIYITENVDKLGMISFSFVTESEWKRNHSRKPGITMPPLTKDRYPFVRKVFCKYCGSALRRKLNENGTISWVCNGNQSKGPAFCKGINIPNDVLMKVGIPDHNIYIGKEIINGEEHYGYSSEPDEDKLGKLKHRKED